MMQAKVPPHDLDAEKSVLGAILIDRDAIITVAEILRAEHFYDERHQIIYAAIESLFEKRQPIDVVTLTNQLKKTKQLGDVGGATTIGELSNAVSTSSNVGAYAKIVKECAMKRAIISVSAQLTELAFDESKEIENIVDTAEQKVYELSQSQSTRSFIPIKEALAESFERLDELQKNGGQLRGVQTGFADLDSLLAGLQKSNLIILAARPGIGKTAFALNMAQFAAVVAKKRIGFFSLEMSREELVDRLLVGQADIDAWRLKTGRLDQQDYLKLSDAMGVLADAQIFIDDTPGLSVFEMRTKARRVMSEQGIDLLIVDYLQLARGRTVDNRVQEVAEISQGLKNIARELRIPVLALSQLSRAIESRGERVPQLSDLRESGCLAGESLVYLPDSGRSVPIHDLVGKSDFRVLAMNQETYQLEPAEVSNVFSTGVKPVYQMTTQLGRSIRATGNHKFFTMQGWKRLDELKVGDHIAVPRELTQTTQQTMTNEELGLLGHLIGDGCTLPKHAIQYTTREKDLAATVASLAAKTFEDRVLPRIQEERSWYQVYFPATRGLTRGKHNPISEWLSDMHTFGLRSYEKFVPEKVFEQPNEAIGIFLRHLWATDGCINCVATKQKYPRIYYASSSKKLAQDVQTLLLKVGINSRLTQVSQKEKGRDQYNVDVTGDDIRRFIETIGAVGAYRKASLAAVHQYMSSHSSNTNRDIIPADVWKQYVIPSMKSQNISQRKMQKDLENKYMGTGIFKQNISRKRAEKLARIVKSEEIYNLSRSNIYWDKIKKIEFDTELEVYDITVPSQHNFVVNNVIAHNSIEQDADVVMFLYRKDDDIREAVNLKVAKHRNGPLGEVDLYFKGDRIKFFGMETRRM